LKKTKRELKSKRENKKTKKRKRKNTPRARGFFKNSGCYAFLGGF
jgi:hypothetical protein